MTGYTPTTEQIRTEWALSNPGGSPTTIMHAEAAFDRWLAAHDAEVRAGVVPEEPEWEIEVSYSSGSAPSIDGYRLRRAMKVESVEKAREFAALVERPMIRKRTKAVPAGPWLRVEGGE